MDQARGLRHRTHTPGWLAWCTMPAILGLVGCAECLIPPPVEKAPPALVLTFDDGPFPSDFASPLAGRSTAELLEPLRAILATLARNDAHAVFFVQGPGDEVLDAEGEAAFATALREMHEAGHTLGYHAYNADPALWIRPSPFPGLAAIPMAADLERLVLFLDDAARQAGLEPDEIFTPVFRQPFGGAGISRVPAFLAARARCWIYRGFYIDSADWVRNSDSLPFIAERFAELDEAEYVEFVVDRLRDGVQRTAGEAAPVDVLLHVNSFTAAHLQTWLDALQDETAAIFDVAPGFAVPDQYIRQSDLLVDLSIIADLP